MKEWLNGDFGLRDPPRKGDSLVNGLILVSDAFRQVLERYASQTASAPERKLVQRFYDHLQERNASAVPPPDAAREARLHRAIAARTGPETDLTLLKPTAT